MRTVNSVIIALITLVATASVVSGLNYGIKFLSILAFNAGMFLLSTVFFLDNTWFFLNLMVQTFGHYFQNFILLSFFTDAFAEIGRDGNGAQGSALSEAPDGFYPWETSLMAPWTIFYWGWWISWAPFVGTFLARISRGRTVGQLIVYSLIAPLLYCIIWFCVFGGGAIKDQWTFLNAQAANAAAATPVYETVVDAATGIDCYRVNAGGLGLACNLWGSASADEMFFLLLQSYEPYGNVLTAVSIFCLTVYFITSSDSGSLVVDTIAANGKECSVVQRILWSFTEGAVAIGLMIAGGSESTGALQAVSVVMGLPYTIVLCFMCLSLSVSCAQEDKMLKGDRASLLSGSLQGCRSGFKLELYRGIFDILEFVCSLDKQYLNSFLSSIVPFLRDSILPFLSVWSCFSKLGNGKISGFNMLNFVLAVVFTIMWISLGAATVADAAGIVEDTSYAAFSLTFYLAFVCVVTQVRTQVRLGYQIEGSIVEDFLASFFLYPMVLMQCAVQVEESPDVNLKKVQVEESPEQVTLEA
jgi:choline-glycine betaine transporter